MEQAGVSSKAAAKSVTAKRVHNGVNWDAWLVAITLMVVVPLWGSPALSQASDQDPTISPPSATAAPFSGESAVIDRRVASLIKKMLKHKTEQKAFADLEALGCAAVPAIIAQMDDRRKLPDPQISLTNKARDAWEARRFYRPEQIVDALDAILNQLTGYGGNIPYGHATNADRTKSVGEWRDWLSKAPRSRLCTGG